jgi:2-haloacid dehalogenase
MSSPIFVFDAYGTLFDVHAAIARYRHVAGPDADRLSDLWRSKQLEYTWTLTLAGRYADFWTLTERALDFALVRVPSVDKALKPNLLDAYLTLDVYADARAVLHELKTAKQRSCRTGRPTCSTEPSKRQGLGKTLTRCSRSTAFGCINLGPRSTNW